MKNKMPKICVFLKYPCYPTKCTATFQVPIQKKERHNPLRNYSLKSHKHPKDSYLDNVFLTKSKLTSTVSAISSIENPLLFRLITNFSFNFSTFSSATLYA